MSEKNPIQVSDRIFRTIELLARSGPSGLLDISNEPELTSVDNHLEKMCNDTVDYMLRVLQGDTDVPPQNEVVCEIKKRCTTDF